jgi:thiamine biosynthesis lipoprotein
MAVSVRRMAGIPHPASPGPVLGLLADPAWTGIPLGSSGVAVAERDALGTTARVAAWPPHALTAALRAVDVELARLDRQASRFRADSELSRIHRTPGAVHRLSSGLAEAVGVALAAAAWTGGLVDPTVGGALIALGYDRDFAAIGPGALAAGPGPGPAPGWNSVSLDGAVLRLPAGVRLDLGATAKGLGADRTAAAAGRAVASGGVLVGLGGDIAVAGRPPLDGWPVILADSSDARGGPDQVVRLASGGLATSSVTSRRWRRAGRAAHHIIDPRTGFPADGPWQTVSVAAASCAEANAASTAAIVAGRDAEEWLAWTGLSARLISRAGEVRLMGGWPTVGTAPLRGPLSSRLPLTAGGEHGHD